MSTVNINRQVEKALQLWIKSQNPLTVRNIYKGIERPSKTTGEEPQRLMPCVICHCKTSEPYAVPSGNRKANAVVEVHANAKDTTEDEFHLMADEIISLVQTDSIAGDLSSILTEFTAFMVVAGVREEAIEGDHWVARWHGIIYCCGADIS